MEYLYQEGDAFHFMNSENYEQVHLNREQLGDLAKFLLPNMQVTIDYIDEKPVGIELPQKVTLKVVETEPGIKNATATSVMKPAKMDSGATVNVPPFVEAGDSVVVNTETGEYVSRG
jgi:elongation factor P